MTTDTNTLAEASRSELIVSCDRASIETAWRETVQKIENGDFFSYSLEPADNGKTKITIWPFATLSRDDDNHYAILQMLDLPNADNFVQDTFLPYKKKFLKKLCVLCLTRTKNTDPIRVMLMVDCRAGKDKTIIFNKAYRFCSTQFRDAYVNADAAVFAPARTMDEIHGSLADKLR